MNRLKALIRSIFAFSRTETNAFLILLPLMVLIIFSEPAYRYWVIRHPQNFTKDSLRLDSLLSTWKWQTLDTARHIYTITPFHFNPNKATNKDFLALGFSKTFAGRIINYRSKGGTFNQRSDLLKMYGVDSGLYQKLYPFIDLPIAKKTENIDRLTKTMIDHRKAVFTKVDLNLADTTEFIKIYGIGKKRSEWIVHYRTRLGGFISMDQLKEVYGLDSAVLSSLNKKYFIQTDFMPHQIPINKATVKELSDHPYLSYKLANAIVAYRFQHGSFQSMDDLVNIRLITEADIKRIKPYLTLNP